jgi:hypothetical protein
VALDVVPQHVAADRVHAALLGVVPGAATRGASPHGQRRGLHYGRTAMQHRWPVSRPHGHVAAVCMCRHPAAPDPKAHFCISIREVSCCLLAASRCSCAAAPSRRSARARRKGEATACAIESRGQARKQDV